MARPVWFVELLKLPFPYRHFLGKLTRLPVIGMVVDYMLFDGDDMLYLPVDRVIPVAESIEQPGEMVLPSQIVAHFVEQADCHWIMNECLCRDASTCKDYPIDLGCIFLGKASMGINPQLGRRVTKEEALAHAQRAREAGLIHMVGRNKLDTVWLGVGPGERLMTICNCCPCCCLWRVLPHVTPRIGDKVTGMPGVAVTVTDRCQGCGVCTQGVCFVDAICLDGMDGDRAVVTAACRGCGLCVDVCPEGAIELTIEDSGFVEASIDRLSAVVDVS